MCDHLDFRKVLHLGLELSDFGLKLIEFSV